MDHLLSEYPLTGDEKKSLNRRTVKKKQKHHANLLARQALVDSESCDSCP